MKKTVHIIGVGPGNPELLTRAAHEALSSAALIIGAARVLDCLGDYPAPKAAAIAPEEIVRQIAASEGPVCVAMSGDIGLYSGAAKLMPMLEDCDARAHPGISSLHCMAAKLGQPWQDAHIVSGHGLECDAFAEAFNHAKTFFLTDGRNSAQAICAALAERGLGALRVSVGERLSYPDERIVRGGAEELSRRRFSSMSVVWVENPRPFAPALVQGLEDACFARGDAPMTKQAVRALILGKLRLTPRSVAYDVGAGTGSVSVEMACAARYGRVYAIEREEDACALIEENKRRFNALNLACVRGIAPEALENLPAPDAAFIGGTGKRMDAIVAAVLEKNLDARIVISAITLETVAEALTVIKRYGLKNDDVVQIAASQSRAVGGLHMMTAQNPVYVISADGPGAAE